MIRWLSVALAAGVVLAGAVDVAAAPAVRHTAAVVPAVRQKAAVLQAGRYDRLWLVVSALDGIRLSSDGGVHWQVPRGLPASGSFYSVVADVSRPGMAFATNGDVYGTTDGGVDWAPLTRPPWPLGPAGITALAADPHRDVVYAGSAGVLAYWPARRQWQVWGRGWPSGAAVTALLPAPEHGLYVAAGARLFNAPRPAATWRPVPAPGWSNAPLTAMALGPDGATPYIAVRGHGIATIDRGGAVRPVDSTGLPRGVQVGALQSDPAGGDLYAATDRGLYRRHQNVTYAGINSSLIWHGISQVPPVAITALRPWRQGLIAIGRDGALYAGTHARNHGQSLSWAPLGRPIPAGVAPVVVGALLGAEWQAIAPRRLPLEFTQNCLQFGLRSDVAFDVCGPFYEFYLHFRHDVFGFPIGPAAVTAQGVMRQAFENVWLEWTPRRGVYLAPLGRIAAGRRVFPRPDPNHPIPNTAYMNGYYVDTLFYDYWRRYQWRDASVFGPPISQVLTEPSSDGSGRPVRVQYFLNARLEYRAWLPPTQQIQLSNLGTTIREDD